MKDIVIYGAGGLGKEVNFLIKRINSLIKDENNKWNFIGYVVSDYKYKNSLNIIGDEEWLIKTKDVNIALGIGDSKLRYEIGNRLTKNISKDKFPCLIDPSVIYDESCCFSPGVIIAAGTILTVNIIMKPFSFVNLNCTIGHESHIGFGSVVNPSTNISGSVSIDKGVLIGTGAQILQNLSIDEFATIGAGSVVTKNVKANNVVVGIPAKPL